MTKNSSKNDYPRELRFGVTKHNIFMKLLLSDV